MQFKNIIKILALFTITLFAFACEDVVEVDLEPGDNQLVVDAWINNKPGPQTIRLVRTFPYFDSSPSPAETGATIFVTDNIGNLPYEFKDENNDGNYVWESTDGSSFAEVGVSYTLSITTTDNRLYTALSTMNRIMPIDSIPSEFREEELGQPEGLYAQVYARDFDGEGDAYWIKSFKNGQFLNKPGEMNIAYDASFSPGGNADGIPFIFPIRDAINERDDDNAPWAVGDSMHVEIHSLTEEAYYYLVGARTQMTLGDATLFAEPPSNIPTNIFLWETTENPEPRDVPVGFFNVAGVSEMGRRL